MTGHFLASLFLKYMESLFNPSVSFISYKYKIRHIMVSILQDKKSFYSVEREKLRNDDFSRSLKLLESAMNDESIISLWSLTYSDEMVRTSSRENSERLSSSSRSNLF